MATQIIGQAADHTIPRLGEGARNRVLDGANLLSQLFARARPHLDRREFEYLAEGCLGHAGILANRGSNLADGLATLIAEHDDDRSQRECASGAGAFDDAPTLMWQIAESFREIDSLVMIAAQAADDLGRLSRAPLDEATGPARSDSPQTSAAEVVLPAMGMREFEAGATAVASMLDEIGEISDETLAGSVNGEDTRDYHQIAEAIDLWLQDHYTNGSEDCRKGLLLALANVLCKEADSRFGSPVTTDPLQAVLRQAAVRAAQ